MKFPYSMLLDFVQTGLDAYQVGELLTMAGFELEGIEEVEGEPVLNIKVMSNRGDGLSVYGLSREVLAKDLGSQPTDLYRRAAARFPSDVDTALALSDDVVTIESKMCNRFACRAFVGVPGAAESPEWMQKRLRQTGGRGISLLVDLTNYVMLEIGQPLHAFDRDRLHGGRIVVREAREGETLTTLNGENHILSRQMMICDADRPVGVPGVMGGLETEVTPETTTLLLESANFDNVTIRKTRKTLKLDTEASYRFERSVDPDGVVAAIHRFTELLLDSLPEVQISNIVDHYPRPPKRTTVPLRPSRATRLLGMEIRPEQAGTYLRRLGFDVCEAGADRFDVASPSWRPDIVREADLVEEVARVHGYERIPERLPEGSTTLGGSKGKFLAIDRLREAALRAGFSQILSHTLTDANPLDRFDADRSETPGLGSSRVSPRVTPSEEYALLRDSLLPLLADAAQLNGARNLHFFEIGKVFWREQQSYVERRMLGLLSTGELLPSDRKGMESRSADFFTLKGALEAIFGAVNVRLAFAPSSGDRRFHPTRQAAVTAGDRCVGSIGQIDPDIANALRLSPATYLAEIDIEHAFAAADEELRIGVISSYPAVRRDIALLLDKSVPYQEIASQIALACGNELERQWLFDVYEGAGIPAGKHSLGVALQLRKLGGTFTDEEANQVRDRAVAALARFGATMR